MTTDDSYRTSHARPGYGEYYDEIISSGYTGDLWSRFEVPILEAWLSSARERGAEVAIDFACGTGRITELVDAQIADVVGVDVSEDMLARAKRRCPNVTFVRRDISTGDIDGLPSVDLITAFRFFQNAEPELRQAVMAALGDLLRPGGELILNVQCNGQGPMGLVQRTRRRSLGHDVHTLSLAEVRDLLQTNGFEIAEVVWYGFWPRTGPYLARLGARMQQPAQTLVERLRLPAHRFAQMFSVRAIRTVAA